MWAADYLPFGQAVVTLEKVENNLRFAGQYEDVETGLHYNYWRYYDPALGRYLRVDPIGLEGGMNPYVYVQNDPINWIDPYGLWGVNVGGSGIGLDFSTTLYDSKKGWFPSTKTDLSVSTTLVGGGVQFTFDTELKSRSNPSEAVFTSIAILSKYLGVTFDTELSRGSVNLGLGLGLPITFSTDHDHFLKTIWNILDDAEDPCN